jgi:glucokinase
MTDARACLPHPVLVADIGGTHCRMAAVATPGDRPVPVLRLATESRARASAALADGLRAAREATGLSPRSLALAVAGPVRGPSHAQVATLTNAAWDLDAAALLRDLALESCLLLNDFEALAAALVAAPDLAGQLIGAAKPGASGTRLVLGPGTGFGAACLAGRPGRQVIVPMEAGHMALGPVTEAERALWPAVCRDDPRISIETLLSGAGLSRLHAALAEAERIAPEEVHARALAGDAPALAAVRQFGHLVARVAGDLALATLATGGVWIAGGVLPRLGALADPLAWHALFVDKPPMQALLAGIPLTLVTEDAMAEAGLAQAAAAPAALGLDHRVALPPAA